MRLSGLPTQEIQGNSVYNVDSYPEIHLNIDRLNTSTLDDSVASNLSWRDMMVPVEETAIKRIVRTFFESGFHDALNEACAPETAATYPIICSIAQYTMRGMNFMEQLRKKLFKTKIYRGITAVAEFSETRDWLRSPIRYIAWHPHCFKVAIAGADDQIRVFTDESNQILVKNSSQKWITTLAWRPYSSGELAVGCRKGVYVWTIDIANHTMRASSNFVALKDTNFDPVTSIAWNKDGSLLAVASTVNSDLLIWNYDRLESTLLRRSKFYCSLLKWSPDNSCLLSVTTSNVFRVWYTEKKWTPERWNVPEGSVQSACWSPCSRVLLFVTTQDSLLYALHFYEDELAQGENASKTATPIADLSKMNVNGKEIGGQPQSLAWDPTGNYLAITFKDSPCIVIYTTFLSFYAINLTPTWFISGFGDEYPSFICYRTKNRFNSDTVLTIGWSSGRVQFFPFANM